MDQLAAYKILGLEPGAPSEVVKEAYAALSKKYHPEEHPEEFQKIHEAYTTLTRRRRNRTVENTYSEWEEPKETAKQPTFNFEDLKVEREQPPTYSFEEAMAKAEREEQEKSHELVLEAAAELKVLVSPKYKNDLKAFKTLFEDKKYEQIIRRADFLEKLCDALEDSKLKKAIYYYIIEFYRLRGRNPSELSQVGLRLYQILDEKAGMKKPVNSAVYGGVVAAVLACIRAIRPILHQSEILTAITFVVIVGVLLFWAGKKFRENHSSLFVQAVIAIGIALSQFVVIMFDIYDTLFGTVDTGNTIAAVIFLAAVAWFIVVIIIAIVKALIGLVNR